MYNLVTQNLVYVLYMCVWMLTVYQLLVFTAFLLTLLYDFTQYYTCKLLSNQNIEILIEIPKVQDKQCQNIMSGYNR